MVDAGAQRDKLMLGMTALHVRMPVATPLPVQLPVDYGLDTWLPVTHLGNVGGIPTSWF